nr:hypothetical protein [Tanacetum cinerariifolium]
IKRLQAQLGDLKGKSKDTSSVSNTLDHLSQKLENENVELEFYVLNYAKENAYLKTTYKNLYDSISVTRTQTKTIIESLQNKLHDTINENAKLRAQLFDQVSEQKDTTKDTNNAAKTRRPQPRSNTKNDRVPSASKSSCNKNKEVEVEEHPRNLLLSKNKKHMSSECNNVKLAIRNAKSKVVCAMCKQCLIIANHDVCVHNYVNDMNSRDKKLKENVSNTKNQKKQKPKVMKPKKLGFNERLASPKPSKPRPCLRVYNQRTKKITETINVTFDQLSAMAFEQSSLKPGIQSMTSGHISSGLDLTYASSTITTQQPTEGELDLLFKAMCNDYIGCQPNQLRSDGDICMYSLTVTNMELKNVKEAMTYPAWIESIQEELLQFKRLDGFIDADRPSHVYKLKKALYGLKQAPRAWYDELSTFLLHNHFFKGTIDLTLFIRCFDNDILVSNYVLEILKQYGMETCDPVGTPIEIKDKINLDQNRTLVDATKYQSMIGALMYLTSSRPEIVHATCLCARYQANPTKKHLKEVKRIFCYLQGTVNTSLWYTKDSGFKLTGFSYADYAGRKGTFKSTFGGAQFLGNKLVSWSSKKQDCTALSIAEAEYVSLSACSIAISYNPVQHSRTKHIVVHYYFIKKHVEKDTIELYFVKTDYQLDYLFTKALPVDRFNYLDCFLGMRSLSPQELERLAKSQ